MTNRLAQLLALIESPCQLTVTAPPQLSLVVTLLVSGAGTSLAQLTVKLVEQVRLGGVGSRAGVGWAPGGLLAHKTVARGGRGMTNRLAPMVGLVGVRRAARGER